MKVAEAMSKTPTMISEDATIVQAAKIMSENKLGVIPVHAAGNKDQCIGMLTDRDIVVRGIAQGKSGDAKVSEVMTKDVICVKDTDDLEMAAKLMKDKGIHRLMVKDAKGSAHGILSFSDLVFHCKDQSLLCETMKGIKGSTSFM